MSRIRANFITNRLANGAPTVSNGLVVSGVTTTTNLDITGNVSIGGTLTYEDVTNIDSVGIITAQSGIHIDDSISHIGDTDTKIRFPLGDTITAQTGGNERVRIDSSGRVLIGTTVEGEVNADDLTIATTGKSGITIRSGNTHNGVIQFSDGTSGTNEYAGFIDYDHNTNVLKFGTASTERLRVDSSGRVLIGTTTEGHENGDDLTIATSGTTGITIRSGTSGGGNIYFSDATSGTAEYAGWVSYSHVNNSLLIGTNSTEKLRIMSNGYMGLGISNPSRRIHVHTSGSGSDYMQFTNDTTGTTDGDGYVFGINGNEDVIHNNLEATNTIFFTSGAERLRIDSNGRIGLGINNPGDYFSSYNRVVMGRTNDTGGMTIVSSPTSGGYIVFADGTSGNQAYRGMIAYQHSSDSMRFSTDADSPTMVLDNAKRVGINSTTPRTYLQVSKGSSHYNPGNPTAFNSSNVLACFENNDDVEVTLLSPNNKKNIINFGDTDNVANSSIEYDHSINHLIFKVNGGSERLRINNSGAFGLAGQNYGTSGQVLKSGGTNGVPTWGAGGNFTSYAIVAEVRSGTSDAGTLTANTWMTRAINTEIADPDGIVSISSNQFTLQAGTYLIEWSAPAWRCDRHTTRLYDVTNSAARGNATLEFSQDSGSYTQSSSKGFARVTISGATVYKLETKGQVTKSGDGLGIDPNNLASCIYAMAKIYKEV